MDRFRLFTLPMRQTNKNNIMQKMSLILSVIQGQKALVSTAVDFEKKGNFHSNKVEDVYFWVDQNSAKGTCV